MTRPALFADLDRCTGCRTCMTACKVEKKTPAGIDLIRLRTVGPDGDFPAPAMYYLPLACQHCGRPACAEACPEGAIHRSETGAVTVDAGLCNGCGRCAGACPYGAIVVDEAREVAVKCDLCSNLLALDRPPACVAVCPARALRVVDLDHMPSESPPEAGRRRPVAPFALLVGGGTDPGGRFILTCQEWRDRL